LFCTAAAFLYTAAVFSVPRLNRCLEIKEHSFGTSLAFASAWEAPVMSEQMAMVSEEGIERRIHLIRGHRVMLSGDLAELYGVEPKVLVQAVKRNRERFPRTSCFSFQIKSLQT
jgi:hypothetical protein